VKKERKREKNMDAGLWVAQGLLAVMFLMVGTAKVTKSKEELAERLDWVEDFSEGTIKFIGSVEILAAIGLILPGLTGIAPILVPIAATGLVVTQIGAIIVHVRRSEPQMIIGNVALIALALFVAWGRFGDYPL
jgi:uncharacterized membrane protein YphA (DoxX/SURF4 family)